MNDVVLSITQWSDFERLYYREQEKLVKLTNITEVSIHTKPIERQKVAPVLQIFNERTIAALKCYPELYIEPNPGTSTFIEKNIGIFEY